MTGDGDDQEREGDEHARGPRRESPGEPGLDLPTLPPVIFGVPLVIGALVHIFLWRGDIIGGALGGVAGIILVVVGLWLIYWTWITMRAHGEHPEPDRPTETLVTGGPFKRTRNPIYAGFLLIGAGVAISLNAMAILIAALVGVAALTVLVIRKEEAYLERKFGEVYRTYVSNTRRWL